MITRKRFKELISLVALEDNNENWKEVHHEIDVLFNFVDDILYKEKEIENE